ncbi:aldehyde dehydrogenase 22A1, partial [Tanacetum coccineum]
MHLQQNVGILTPVGPFILVNFNFVFSHIDDPAMVTGIGSIDGKSYMVCYIRIHVAQVAARAALQSSGHNCVGGSSSIGKYDMGAICMQDHSETLQSLINDALDKGAEIVAGGSVTNISEGVVNTSLLPSL